MNTERGHVQSHYNVTAKSHSNSFSNPFHIHYSTRSIAHERKESELHIRQLGLCQNQKSLRHEAKQTLQYSEEREISCKPQGTFPRRSRVAEKGKILWVLTAMNSISAFLKVVSCIKIQFYQQNKGKSVIQGSK